MAAGTIGSDTGSGARRGRRRRRARPMSEINVTPFVDVMLVLLIVFMVAAPLLTTGVPVQLPQAAARALPTEPEEPLTVTLTADGRTLLMSSETESVDLVAQLTAIAAERDSRRVYLRADGSIPYETVMRVMATLAEGGFADIGLVTDSTEPGQEG